MLNELTHAHHRTPVDAAISASEIDLLSLTAIEELELYGKLRDRMGRGEAACLALATTHDFYLASDEKKRFRREAIQLIGEKRILRTEDLLREAIRSVRINVTEADHYKALLAEKRYVMSFESFADSLITA